MIEYSNILAVVEPERENQPAISRAIELAEKNRRVHHRFNDHLRFLIRNDHHAIR